MAKVGAAACSSSLLLLLVLVLSLSVVYDMLCCLDSNLVAVNNCHQMLLSIYRPLYYALNHHNSTHYFCVIVANEDSLASATSIIQSNSLILRLK